jgi:23S rRNA pseudouridine955/2504/2580 synthase
MKLICLENTNLKDFTDNNYAQASFFWSYLIKNKEIKVNGKKVDGNVKLECGDEVVYFLSKKQQEKPAFYILYEDENVLVVDKESGVNSEAVFAELSRSRECYFIHRLDRNTKGLIFFALNKKAEQELLFAFKERLAKKVYHALLFGDFKKERESLAAYLKKNPETATVKVFSNQKDGSEKIITEYEVLVKYGEVTKVQVWLHTGKTHQIRAHLAFIGCPIVGDMKYGIPEKNKQYGVIRQQLLSKSLTFYGLKELGYLNGKEFLSKFELLLS